MFHKHKWVQILKTYAPPAGLESIEGGRTSVVERMVFGITEILWECEGCKKVRKESLLGKEVSN